MKKILALTLIFCIGFLPFLNTAPVFAQSQPTQPDLGEMALLENTYGPLKFPGVLRVLYRGTEMFYQLANPLNMLRPGSSGYVDTPPGWLYVLSSIPVSVIMTAKSIPKAIHVDAEAIKHLFQKNKKPGC